jgi:hypothetical protein
VADRTLEVQKALVLRLKSVSAVTSLVSTRVYDRAPEKAAFPYISIGDVAATPFDAQLLRGYEALWQIHAWSRKPGAVQCRQVLAAAHGALHWHSLNLDAGAAVICRVSGKRDLKDPDGVTTHGILDLTILTDG